ncbi:hypothetical protein [Frigoribacterium sp. 9N]|uniref:hypothetical protein n=1 Tax=Frigoribacterium sp. 9N TaxID=2653144 RepID=UPI0012F37D22|nr:hypothetical protein [Frigoribacterium sp. 9N]VXB72690.1 hypothetical protein FRIGORI9N_400127 [Frigoribacterium sp. 9N]
MTDLNFELLSLVLRYFVSAGHALASRRAIDANSGNTKVIEGLGNEDDARVLHAAARLVPAASQPA